MPIAFFRARFEDRRGKWFNLNLNGWLVGDQCVTEANTCRGNKKMFRADYLESFREDVVCTVAEVV